MLKMNKTKSDFQTKEKTTTNVEIIENQDEHPTNRESISGRIENEQEEDQEEWTCPICMEEVHNPVVTLCGHIFCQVCIEEWLYSHDVCPFCNHHGITKKNIIYLKGQGIIEDRPIGDNTHFYNTNLRKLQNFLSSPFFVSKILVFIVLYIAVKL